MRDGVFGIAFGATWNAADSVLRIDTDLSPDEVQFQPGVYLVKAGPIREEIVKRAPTETVAPAVRPVVEGDTAPVATHTETPEVPVAPNDATRVEIRLTKVPADRARDVLKVAILPLATTGATVEVLMEIKATSESGIPDELLELTIAEGLRQLGIDFEVDKQ